MPNKSETRKPHQIPKLVRRKAAVLRLGLRLGQHVRVGQYVWSGQLVWRSLVRDVGQGVVCSRRFMVDTRYGWMTPAVDRCLPFAFEITLGKITAVDGTAVFTESIAVSRPFVSDVSLLTTKPRDMWSRF